MGKLVFVKGQSEGRSSFSSRVMVSYEYYSGQSSFGPCQPLSSETVTSPQDLQAQVKAFVQENKTEFSLYEHIRDEFINSPDEDVRRFVSLIQRPFYASSSILNFVFSLFQLIISALLLVLGISIVSPSVLNISITDLLQQFASFGQAQGSNTTYVLEGLLFVTGITFITDAFNHLRSAAFFLRVAGIEIQEPTKR